MSTYARPLHDGKPCTDIQMLVKTGFYYIAFSLELVWANRKHKEFKPDSFACNKVSQFMNGHRYNQS